MSTPQAARGGERSAWLAQQIADGEGGLAELRAELDGLRSTIAKRAVEAEIERQAQALAGWQAEFEREQGTGRAQADVERLRTGMRYLRDTPDLWQLTRPELRNILQAHLPDLYALDGLIVGAPVTG